jgi:type I restriction enzyme S subunit
VKLSDVAILSSGGTPSKGNAAFWDGDIPWVSPKDMKLNHITCAEDNITRAAISESAARIVGSNSVLAVVRSGILAHTFPVATLARDVSFNQDIKAITPKNGSLLPAFLFWMLKGQEDQILRVGVKKGATVHSLANGFLEALRFPLPPIDEQQRIVGLLNRAAEIRRRAAAARAKARAIIPALFLATFGDPATNPKGWPVKTLGDLGELDRGRSRHRPRNAPELYGGVYPFVQTGDVANSMGRIRRHEQTYSEAGLAQSKMWPAGTLCITIAANIGKTGILEFDACFPDSVVGFKPSPEVTSEFVQSSLDFMQAEIEARAPQAAQKNINLQVLRGLEMICPPLGLQTAFAEQVHRLELVAHHLDAAAAKAEAMAAGLSAELFDSGTSERQSRTLSANSRRQLSSRQPALTSADEAQA